MSGSPGSVAEREKYKRKLVRVLAESPFMPDRRKRQLLKECKTEIIPGKTEYELLYDALMGDEETFERLKHWVDSSFKSKKKNYMEPRKRLSYDIHINVVDGPAASNEERRVSRSERERIRKDLAELEPDDVPEPQLKALTDLVLQSGGQVTPEETIEVDFDEVNDETVSKIGRILAEIKSAPTSPTS